MDLPLRGGDFTWSRSGADSVASRLDRFIMLFDWEEFFYHFPICFETSVL